MTETDLVTAGGSTEQAELPNTVNSEFSSPATPDVPIASAGADQHPADAPAPRRTQTSTQGGRNHGRLEGVAVDHGAARTARAGQLGRRQGRLRDAQERTHRRDP